MPVTDFGHEAGAAGGLYDAVCTTEQSEFELWIGQGWRRDDPERPYHRQEQLDAARARAPITLCLDRLPCGRVSAAVLQQRETTDMFDRVTVSQDDSIQFTGGHVDTWCLEHGL
jgi:hypothetical protein